MPENNFEKRVQQKMEELKLSPSAEVWEEVEKRIRKEKKRRRIIFWFFLFGALLVGGTGWWIIEENKKQTSPDNPVVQTIADKKIGETTSSAEIETKNKTTAEIKSDSSYKKGEQKTQVHQTNNPVITKTETVLHKKEFVTTQTKRNKEKEEVARNSFSDVLENISIRKEKSVLPVTTKPIEQITVQKKIKVDSITKTGKTVNADASGNAKDSSVSDKSIVSGRSTTIPERENPILADSLVIKNTEAVVRKKISKPKKNKWEFGITGMLGSSKKSKAVSIFSRSSDALNSQSSSGSQAGNPTPRIQPAAPGSGFSGELGAYVKRKLNARTGLSIGLNFASYSTTQLTGAFVDSSRVFSSSRYSSSVQDFYRSGSAATYKNHYYYLQIPFSFHWQINKSTRMPLIFQNGLSFGIFTGSDALIYNSASNVFYKDNKSFNKIQLSYQSGLYARMFNRIKKPLTVGILYNYQLSRLQKVNINGGNHLSSFGLQLGWLLKK